MAKEKPKTVVPKLRFPEFSSSWDECTVGGFFDLSAKAEKLQDFDADRLLTVKLYGKGVVKNERSTLTGGANYFIRKAGQFIFSKIDLLNGAFGIVPDELGGYSSSSDVPSYSFRKDQSSAYFLHWLNARYDKLVVERTGTSSTLKRVSPEKFLSLDLFVPSPKEQKKIADCLTSLDELIAAQGRKVEALKTYKRGLMQQLFPRDGETVPRLRFPEFKKAPRWNDSSLAGIAAISSGTTPLRANSEFYLDGTIPWVKTTDLNNSFIESTEECITSSARATINPVGSILVAMYGGFKQIGRTGYLKVPAATNQALSVLQIRDERVSPIYLLSWLNAKVDDWRRIASSSRKDPNITGSDVAAFRIKFPLPDEQLKIAEFLLSFDDRLTNESSSLDALRIFKQALMQQLFPSVEEGAA